MCIARFQIEELQQKGVIPTARVFPEIARTVRERNALNRCDSDTDSKVWMEEDVRILRFSALSGSTQGIFYGVKAMKKIDTKKMVLLAMLAAVAFMLVALIRIPVVLFLSYEPKDVVITVGGFLLGPMASFVISLVVALVEMVTISTTGPIGCLMNLLSSACFACTAALNSYQSAQPFSDIVSGHILPLAS